MVVKRKGNKSTEREGDSISLKVVIISMKACIPHLKTPGFKIKVTKNLEGIGY